MNKALPGGKAFLLYCRDDPALSGCTQHIVCKSNLLPQLKGEIGDSGLRVIAVGDGGNDVCYLREAGIGITFEQKVDSVRGGGESDCERFTAGGEPLSPVPGGALNGMKQ